MISDHFCIDYVRIENHATYCFYTDPGIWMCPPGWYGLKSFADDSYDLDFQYGTAGETLCVRLYPNSRVTWKAAQDTCRAQHGHLLLLSYNYISEQVGVLSDLSKLIQEQGWFIDLLEFQSFIPYILTGKPSENLLIAFYNL